MRLPCPETCKKCGGESEVQDTRLTKQGYRYRRRVCTGCGRRWNTYETLLNPRRIVPPKTTAGATPSTLQPPSPPTLPPLVAPPPAPPFLQFSPTAGTPSPSPAPGL